MIREGGIFIVNSSRYKSPQTNAERRRSQELSRANVEL